MSNRSTSTGSSAEIPSSLESVNTPRQSRWRTVLGSVPIHIIGGFLFVGGAVALVAPAARWLLVHSSGKAHRVWQSPLIALTVISTVLVAYVLFVRLTEGRRRLLELSAAGAPWEWIGGAGLGTGMFGLTTLLLWMAGVYRVGEIDPNPWSVLLSALPAALAAAFVEETLFRGLLFRLSARSFGSRWAILISAAVFGLMHMANPHANWWAGTAIATEAGVFLAAAYLTTRRLWFPVGAHFGWNYTQSGIFGGTLSGTAVSGLLRGKLSGPVWLSGGAFGVETSVVAVLVCFGVAMLLLWRDSRREAAGHLPLRANTGQGT